MKKLIVTGALLVFSAGLFARSLHVYNFTDMPQVVKIDVAGAIDPNKEVAAGERQSLSIFGCEGINNVRKVEARSKLGGVEVKGGWSACKSRQGFLTPIIDENGKVTGVDLEIR